MSEVRYVPVRSEELFTNHFHDDGTIYLTYPRPAKPVSSNELGHWSKTQPMKEAWRDTATLVAQQLKTVQKPMTGLWEVTIRIPFDRKAGRRDPHNYVGTVCKWTVDGLVIGGLWPDDTPEFVSVREPELVVKKGAPVQIRLYPMRPQPKVVWPEPNGLAG